MARRGSVRWRLGAIALLASLPLLVLVILNAMGTFQASVTRGLDTAGGNAEVLAGSVDGYIGELDRLLVAVGAGVGARRGAEADEALADVLAALPSSVERLDVLDVDGTTVATSGPAASGDGAVDDDVLRSARARPGQLAIRARVGDDGGPPRVALARASSGESILVHGLVSLETLQDVLPVDLPAGVTATVVDADGTIIARTDEPARFVGQRLVDLDVPPEATASARPQRVMGLDGEERFVGSHPVAAAPWTTYVSAPTEATLGSAMTRLLRVALVGVGTLAFALGLALLVARSITQPLARLSADADQLATGDLGHRTAVASDDELGVLAERFNGMAASLERRSAEVAAVVRSAPLPVVVVDDAGLVRSWNPAAETVFGWAEAAVLGRANPLPGAVDGAAPLGAQVEARTREGTALIVEVACSPLCDATGAPLGAVLVYRDETARRELEARAAQSAKMEAVGKLAGGVAHDFNNLLTAIGGFTELAHARALVHGDATTASHLEEVLQAADRARRLVEQLLTTSRRRPREVTTVDVDAVVDDIAGLLQGAMGEAHRLRLALTGAGQVRLDRDELEHVLINLTVNACDAMPGGGEVTIGTAIDGDDVVLSVADSGVGMTPEVAARATEPFFTTKPEGAGTGLGLATAYGAVTAAGGSLAFDTTPGVGTVVLLRLPRAGAPTVTEVTDGTAPPRDDRAQG